MLKALVPWLLTLAQGMLSYLFPSGQALLNDLFRGSLRILAAFQVSDLFHLPKHLDIIYIFSVHLTEPHFILLQNVVGFDDFFQK